MFVSQVNLSYLFIARQGKATQFKRFSLWYN